MVGAIEGGERTEARLGELGGGARLEVQAMVAAKRDWNALTGMLALLHVASRRDDRAELGLSPRQGQTQVQARLRIHW